MTAGAPATATDRPPAGTGAAGGTRRRPPAEAGAAAVGVALAGTAAWSAAGGLAPATAAGLLGTLAVLTVAGAGVWALVVPASPWWHRTVLGCLLGLAIAGLGVVLSGATGVFLLRWLPPALALVAWVPVLRRIRAGGEQRGRPGMGWALWGAVLAQGALLVSLRAHLATVPVGATDWRAYYVDIPWHIAFTAEALARAPEVYPWVPDVSLGYTWLFSAALGGWGSATSVSAADLVTRLGPALFSVMTPLVVAITAWTMSRSRLATFLAPVLVTLAQGPLFIFRDTMDITPLWLIPNRDYSNLIVLVAVTLLASTVPRLLPRPRWSVAGPALLLCLLSFTASGAKGSALPVLLGAAGILVLYALLDRRPVAPHLVRLGAVCAGMLAAQYTVTRSLSYLRLDPLTFLGGQAPPGLDPLLTVLVVALLLGSLLLVLLSVLPDRVLAPRALPLVGGGVGGVAALAVFGHPGLSQLYFLHAAWPLVCIGVAIALAVLVRLVGPASLVAFVGAAAAFAVVLAPPAPGQVRGWAVAAVAVLAAVAAAVLVPVLVRAGHGSLSRPAAAAVIALLSACFAVQNWGQPSIALPASTASSPADRAAIDGAHHAAYAALRAASDPDDLVMTNKHCQSGSVATGDCDPRWFGTSAFAERRVLVEGWSYTRLSAGVPREDVYWRADLLARNDGFLADPTTSACREFVRAGVEWVLVDKREPWSARLAEVATPLYDSTSAAVYRLDDNCAAS